MMDSYGELLKLFDRSVKLIMSEWPLTRQEVLEWLADDTDDHWIE